MVFIVCFLSLDHMPSPRISLYRGRETLPRLPTLPAVSLVCFCCRARSLCSTTESPWLLNPYLVHINAQGRVELEGDSWRKHPRPFPCSHSGYSLLSNGWEFESPWKHTCGVSVRLFPGRLTRAERTHHEHGQHHPMGSHPKQSKEKETQTPASSTLCFVTGGTEWPSALGCCHQEGLCPQTVSQNKRPLLKLIFVSTPSRKQE